jgi:hypothetical protein
LFENGKLYCSTCAGNITRLGIERVIRDDERAVIAESGGPIDQFHGTDENDAENEKSEHVMADEPVQPNEIAVMLSLATPVSVMSTPVPVVSPNSGMRLHGVLDAERC